VEISLVTGAHGFVGRALFHSLKENGIKTRGSIRKFDPATTSSKDDFCIVEDLSSKTDWSQALSGVNIVYHLASTVHRPDITDPKIYYETITEASIHLAKQAQAAGVKRLVYVSTAHVYSLNSVIPLKENTVKNPVTTYAKAKLAAEEALIEFAEQSHWEIAIVRPPLIYGNEVRANFGSLVNLVKKFPFLPFGKASAKRSFVGIRNLISFLQLCATHSAAKNDIFNVTDDEDLSVAQLCQLISSVLEKKTYLLPIPNQIMKVCLMSLGKIDLYEKLFQPLQLDISRAKQVLNWNPIFTVRDELNNIFEEND
jgi:nucleoside-diphosphate-sugar epimerase